jgi:hypothetical protein
MRAGDSPGRSSWGNLHIINDGSTGGGNDASFAIWLVQGFGSSASVLRHYELARRRINDRPDPGDEAQENIDLSAEFGQPDVIGPSVVDPNTPGMALLTRGLAEDDFGTDDPADNFKPGPQGGPVGGLWNSRAQLLFLDGPDDEEMDDVRKSVQADPTDGDQFRYSVEVRYSVTYV